MFTLNVVVGIAIVLLVIGLYYTEKKGKKGILVLLLLIATAVLNQGKEIMNYHSEWQARRTTREIAEARKREGISDPARADRPKEQYPDEIVKMIEKLARIEKSGIELEPEAYLELAMAAYNREEYRKTARNINIAITLKEDYVAAYNLLGLSYTHLGELDSALLILTKGLELAQEQKLARLQGSLLHNMALVYHQRDQFQVAVQYLGASLERDQSESNRDISATYIAIADAFYFLGKEDSTSYYYDRALARSGDRDPELKSAIYNRKAWVYIYEGALDSALVCFGMSEAQEQQHRVRTHKAYRLTGSGYVFYLMVYFDKSDSLVNAALTLHREITDHSGEGIDLRFLGLIQAKKANKDEALRLVQEALATHEKLGSPLSLARDHEALGDVWGEFGDLEKSKKHYIKALGLVMEMGITREVEKLEKKLAQII